MAYLQQQNSGPEVAQQQQQQQRRVSFRSSVTTTPPLTTDRSSTCNIHTLQSVASSSLAPYLPATTSSSSTPSQHRLSAFALPSIGSDTLVQTRGAVMQQNREFHGGATQVETLQSLNDSARRDSNHHGYHVIPPHDQLRPPAQLFQTSGSTTAVSTGTTYKDEERMYHGGLQIIGEQVIEHNITVPTKRVWEETVEKVIVVPEKVKREEIVEETKTVRERVVQLAKPVLKEKIVEVVNYEYQTKTIEVPTPVEQEKIVYNDVVVYQEVEVPKPKIVQREKLVEVEQIEYVHVPVHKQVEVPETRNIVKVVEKPVPRYVEVEVPEYKEVEVIQEVQRKVPVACEHVVHTTYMLPAVEPEYEEVPVPVFVPTFTEIPIPAEYMTDEAVLQAEQLRQQVAYVAAGSMPSLCVIEQLGEQARKTVPKMITDPNLLAQRMAQKVSDYNAKHGVPKPQAP